MQAQPPPPPPPLPSNPGIANSFVHRNLGQIQPTRAGLLDYRGHESAPIGKLGSQMFKDELKEKHSMLSNQEALGSNIEDRIKANREESRMQPNLRDEVYANGTADRLMQTSKLERKPFAYSPDMSDPNNRGKLDLAHIKSAAMRRRLMVNMKSSESYGDEDTETLGCSNETETVPLRAPVIIHHPPVRDFNFHKHQSSRDNPQASHCFVNSQTPTIQYNDAPQFYNPSHLDRYRGTRSADPIASDRQRESDERYARLGAELVESLESLSQLVSKLQDSTQAEHYNSSDQRRHNSQPPDQMTSFSPGIMQSSAPQNRSQRNFSSVSQERRIDDYLPVADAQYFTTIANNGPYSVSPFYGDPLDIQHCAFAPISSLPTPRQVMSTTFIASGQTNR